MFLLSPPTWLAETRLRLGLDAEAVVYVLCEGPLAAALIAWQCSWVMCSADHTIRWVGGCCPQQRGHAMWSPCVHAITQFLLCVS